MITPRRENPLHALGRGGDREETTMPGPPRQMSVLDIYRHSRILKVPGGARYARHEYIDPRPA